MRIAFVGAGRRAASQAQTIRDAGRDTIVGAYSRSHEAATRFALRWGLDRAHRSIESLVDDTRPDVVCVVTSPGDRTDVIREAVEAGAKAVLVEKPLALDAEDLAKIEEMSAQALIAVNTQYPWMTHWRRIEAAIRQGQLGQIVAVHATARANLMEQGPHALSIAYMVQRAAGLPAPTWVLAATEGEENIGSRRVPSMTMALADMGQARMSLMLGHRAPLVPGEGDRYRQQQVAITGATGFAVVSLTRGWHLQTGERRQHGSTDWLRDDRQAQSELFDDIRAVVLEHASRDDFPSRIDVAADETRLLLACIESSTTGRTALVRSAPDPPD